MHAGGVVRTGMDAARDRGLLPPRVAPKRGDLAALDGTAKRVRPESPAASRRADQAWHEAAGAMERAAGRARGEVAPRENGEPRLQRSPETKFAWREGEALPADDGAASSPSRESIPGARGDEEATGMAAACRVCGNIYMPDSRQRPDRTRGKRRRSRSASLMEVLPALRSRKAAGFPSTAGRGVTPASGGEPEGASCPCHPC